MTELEILKSEVAVLRKALVEALQILREENIFGYHETKKITDTLETKTKQGEK